MPVAMYECPHCKRSFQLCAAERHTATCIHAPDMPDRVRATLEDPDRPGVALSRRAYNERAALFNAAGQEALSYHWGPTWEAVARHVGLEPGQKSGFYRGTRTAATKQAAEDAALADVEEKLERDAELRQYWQNGRGLEVCAVREIDGGRRVACMLR